MAIQSQNLRILHVVQGYQPAIGGTEKLIKRVSEELVNRHGDEVTVFTTNCYSAEAFYTPSLPTMPLGRETINGVKIRRFSVLSRFSKFFYLPQFFAYRLKIPLNQYLRAIYGGPIISGLAKAMANQSADLICAASFPLMHMFTSLKVAKKANRPCVFLGCLHPEDDWGYQRPIIYSAIRRATRYVANTKYEADYLIDREIPAEKIDVIGAGIDPEEFSGINQGDARARLGIEKGPVVGFVGQLGGHKGVDTLVRAMPIVWQVLPETKFIIAGAETIFQSRLTSLIDKTLGSRDDRLILKTNFPEDEKPLIVAAADVIAHPSGYESFGISFLEAWASRKPVIGCKRGAIPSVVSAGKDGLLIEYQNHTMLGEAILMLLKNPVWAQNLGQAGYKKVITSFTWPFIADRYRTTYLRALGKV